MSRFKIFWFWIGFFTNLIITVLGLLLSSGCTGDYEKGWSWGVVTEDGTMTTAKLLWSDHEVRIEDILSSTLDEHDSCRKNHYTDPYNKKEYCLPEGFNNMNLIHLYRVGE